MFAQSLATINNAKVQYAIDLVKLALRSAILPPGLLKGRLITITFLDMALLRPASIESYGNIQQRL